MKNKKLTQHIKTTKTNIRHPKNIHQKTDQNQANKKRTKMKISKSIVHTDKPSPRQV